VAAIELSGGKEVERGDEESDPARDEHRMRSNVSKGRQSGIKVCA
jgi:hypothetical protein